MLTIEDNNNYSSNSVTVTGNPRWIYMPYTEPLFPTTDGKIPASNALAETYANIIFPCRIDRLIFHDPATVVYWKDGTKTVVKCHDEPFDREKGLAMCIAKKVLGKDFHKTFREWCK